MRRSLSGKGSWQGTIRARISGVRHPGRRTLPSRSAVVTGVALIAAIGLAPSAVRGEIVDEKEVGRLSLGFMIGYAGNSMDRYDENIGVVNHFLTHQGIAIREADELSGGASVQGELRWKFNPHFSLGFGAASLQSKSAFSVTLAEINFFARSTALSPMLYYHLPFVQSSEAFVNVADRMSLYVGAGPVFLSKGYTLARILDRSNEPQFNEDGDLGELDGDLEASGTGVGVRGLIGGSYQLTSRFSFAAEIGYRQAKVTDLTLDTVRGFERAVGDNDPDRREPLEQAMRDFFDRRERAAGLPDQDINRNHIPYYSDFDGPLELDFSGVTLQVGFRLHL